MIKIEDYKDYVMNINSFFQSMALKFPIGSNANGEDSIIESQST